MRSVEVWRAPSGVKHAVLSGASVRTACLGRPVTPNWERMPDGQVVVTCLLCRRMGYHHVDQATTDDG